MNLIDAWVIKVLSDKPVFMYDKYWVKIEYTCEGGEGECDLMFKTKKEAESIDIGHKFLT